MFLSLIFRKKHFVYISKLMGVLMLNFGGYMKVFFFLALILSSHSYAQSDPDHQANAKG
jgi:hypothetical protein